MKKKTTASIMRVVGATMAVGSAVAMMGATKFDTNQTIKKTMKKTAEKMTDIVDMVTSYM